MAKSGTATKPLSKYVVRCGGTTAFVYADHEKVAKGGPVKTYKDSEGAKEGRSYVASFLKPA